MENIFNGTYYELLEVQPGSPQHEITKAYERAKVTYSSDNPALYTIFSIEEARALLKLIEEAYVILGNTIFRNRYDELMKDPDVRLQDLKFQDIVGPVLSTNVDKTKVHFRPSYKLDEATEEYIRHEENCDGTFLKKIREYKNITPEKMTEITRVNPHYLTALEKNAWKDLPAPVFVRGFVMQISRLLGLDEKKTVESYMRIYKTNTTK